MQTSVKLQEMHSYSFVMIMVVAVFVAASIVAALILIIKWSQKERR